MRRLSDESGHSLMELLVAMSLMMLVLGTTLTVFDSFGRNTHTNGQMNDAQDQARAVMDRVARELRSASAYSDSGSSTAETSAVLRAEAWDLVFQSVDPLTPPGAGAGNKKQLQRVRYCLDTTGNKVWRQRQTWTTATPPTLSTDANCPGSGWTSQSLVAGDVVNGGGRRLFTYNAMDPATTGGTAPPLPDITSIRASVFVDTNVGKAPAETQLATGVFLRNKNRRPIVDCVATRGGPMHVSLNGTGSQDPEGEALEFAWTDNGTAMNQTGPVVDYTSPTTGSHTFRVTVKDVGGLTSTAICAPNPLTVQ